MKNHVYLKNGCEAILHEKLSGNRFVIEKITEFVYESETYTEPCSVQEIVSEIFTSPPVESINSVIKTLFEQEEIIRKEIQQLNTEKQTLRNEAYQAKEELKRITSGVIDISKWRNAKSIVIFNPNDIAPNILSRNGTRESNIRGITIEIRLDGTVSKWYNYDHSSQHIDTNYEVYFDLDDDEITRITNERSENLDLAKITGYKSNNIPEKYQTPKVKAWLEEKKAKANECRIIQLEGEIESRQNELAKLK